MSAIPKVSLKSDTVEVNAKPRPGGVGGADLLIRAEEIKGAVSLLGKYLHMWGEKGAVEVLQEIKRAEEPEERGEEEVDSRR